MAISEGQLTTWAKPGSQDQSQYTYKAIRKVLDDPEAPYHKWYYNIFLQGSYGNDTNIYADSDVDIAMCLTSVYYYDVDSLSDEGKQKFQDNLVPGKFSQKEFKAEVLAWLTKHFGDGVKEGKKAIFIPENGSRRNADVLVCSRHLDYSSYQSDTSNTHRDGICFWTTDGDKIVNYPKQHLANCTTKHQATGSRFKANIRILKNMRNAMIKHGFVKDDVAPSYFLEGMLWNIPNNLYANTYQQTFENYIHWLQNCNSNELLCANQYYYLLRERSPVCWNTAQYNEFRAAAVNYWNSV
jgi:hypothetical protein